LITGLEKLEVFKIIKGLNERHGGVCVTDWDMYDVFVLDEKTWER